MKRMTQQKLDTLRFAGRQRCVRGVHIESRFGIDRSTAYRHLGDLTDDGLLERFDSVSPAGGVFAATRKGLHLAELDLRPAQPDVFHLAHDEAMTEIVCHLEAQHVDLLTERELYAYRRVEEDGRYDFEMYDDAHRRYVAHLPDLVCEIPDADKFIAIEVERRPKNVDRWRSILHSFANRLQLNGFIGVLYVADPTARPKRLESLAQEVGLGERFQLRLNTDPDLLDGLNAIVDAANGKPRGKAK